MPKMGCCVSTQQGPGVVRGQNVLEQTVLVTLETGGQLTLRPTEVTVRPKLQPLPKARKRGEGEAPKPAPEPRADRSAPSATPETEVRGAEAAVDADEMPPDLARLEDA